MLEQQQDTPKVNARPDVLEQQETSLESPQPIFIKNDLSESYEFTPMEYPDSLGVPSEESELDSSFGKPINVNYNMS
jgi:hypothetical protein